MINPNTVNVVIYQSATFDKSFTWTDNGEVMDMTGCELALQIRERSKNGKLLLTASTANGMIAIIDHQAGKFKFNIPAPVTEDMDFDVAVYDLLMKRGERVCRLAQGEVMLSRSNTKLSAFQ